MLKKTLDGAWEFKAAGWKEWLPATVPGCNYLDLLRLGRIEDPFIGTNETKAAWVAREDWEYRRSFEITPGELRCRLAVLVCGMLDTVCEITINGMPAGKGENAHKAYSFDVRSLLREGENEIHILFRSPVRYVEAKRRATPTPVNGNGLNGIVHIRKPQCHFGWDWGPVLPVSGIQRSIDLLLFDIARIDGFWVDQKPAGDRAQIKVRGRAQIFEDVPLSYVLRVVSPKGETYESFGSAGAVFEANLEIGNPMLWQTAELSGKKEQPLYEVSVELYAGSELLDRAVKKIGLRTLELDRGRDEYGVNFRFLLNGNPLFVKGANWIPGDSFITRFDNGRLEYALDAALFSNMNMLRVWGGGYYESDAFYEACDRKGILVWQDFAFACQAYPFFMPDFLENVKDEIRYNVERLRDHPCLALWCGNNEIESLSALWRYMKKYVQWTDEFFYRILEPEIRRCDPVTPYIPGSPCGVSHLKGFDKDNVGDTHLWAVWHGLQPMKYYRKRMTRFCSEFGFESLPDIKTIEKFAQPGDYSLKSQVMKAHQKCTSGNDKMVYYIASRFRLPAKFEDFVYLSQVTQLECVSDATQHWRRNRGRCNGALYWQLNDCWPVCSWASLDYFGGYKALQYAARRFNAPVCVSIEDSRNSIKIFVLNDTPNPVEAQVAVELFDFEKGILESVKNKISAAPSGMEIACEWRAGDLSRRYDLRKTGMRARLIQGDETISSATLLFGNEKDLQLPEPGLTKTVRAENGRLYVTVRAERFARLVRVSSKVSLQPFTDNYFELLPGENVTVSALLEKNQPSQRIEDTVEIVSCADIKPGGARAADALRRLLILIDPRNLGAWLYFRRVPKDLRLP